jgi:AcrR family transcriptional regulator
VKAAAELFADRGFDRATARDIGQRAGVDPTLIARYFGGKTQLFIEVLRRTDPSEASVDIGSSSELKSVLERSLSYGPDPIFQAAIRPYDDPEAQAAALVELKARVVGPLRERLAEEGDAKADLRAELMTAAFLGILLGRRAGTFEHLSEATAGELLRHVEELLAGTKMDR